MQVLAAEGSLNEERRKTEDNRGAVAGESVLDPGRLRGEGRRALQVTGSCWHCSYSTTCPKSLHGPCGT